MINLDMENLSNLEICKRIAEIEGWRYCELHNYIRIDKDSYVSEYNPLFDDALCFQFIIRYKILRELTGDNTFRVVICNWGSNPEYVRATGSTLNEAICKVIIAWYANGGRL